MLVINIFQMMKIRDFAAGSHHAAMVDELGRVFTWGAGSYGRSVLFIAHWKADKTSSENGTTLSKIRQPTCKYFFFKLDNN